MDVTLTLFLSRNGLLKAPHSMNFDFLLLIVGVSGNLDSGPAAQVCHSRPSERHPHTQRGSKSIAVSRNRSESTMNNPDRQAHWDKVYATKAEDEVSWFQKTPAPS